MNKYKLSWFYPQSVLHWNPFMNMDPFDCTGVDFDGRAAHCQPSRRTYIYFHRLGKDIQISTVTIPPISAHFLPSPKLRVPAGHLHTGLSMALTELWDELV